MFVIGNSVKRSFEFISDITCVPLLFFQICLFSVSVAGLAVFKHKYNFTHS